ncbi:MAG: glycosyltransferase family 4 protein [Nitrososphaerales archaeon]|jgi:glycosyltransferase involved in cell wall biosynthesis
MSNQFARFNIPVQVINFDYDRRYAADQAEITKRRKIITESLAGVQLVELSALRLRIPRRISPLGDKLTKSLNEYLRFVPVGSRFSKSLRNSEVVYFVYCQSNPIYLLVTLLMCTLSGKRPLVAGLHATPRFKPHESALLRVFVKIGVLKKVHTINAGQNSVVNREIGCDAQYVPNGVDYERFAVCASRKNERKEFLVLLAGAMTLKKGADLIPAIYDSLMRRKVRFRLVICTSGGPLLGQIHDWSVSKPNVDFRGFVDPTEMPRVYGESAVALLPSRGEAFPLVCIEAQACGTPVVVSDIAGFRQCVIDGRTGLFAVTNNPESYAEKVEHVYLLWKEDSDKYRALCKNANLNVRDNFQLRQTATQLARMLLSVARQ